MRRVALAVLLLAGCVSTPRVPQISRPEAARADYLAAHANWAFNGRIAYSQAGRGGTAQVHWQQAGTVSEVWMRAPLALGSVHLRFDAYQAQMLDATGRPLKSGSPEALLAELLQIAPPLPDFATGLRAYWPDSPALTAAAADGAVTVADWSWRYPVWQEAPVRLPGTIELQRDATRLRFVIDQWQELPHE